jgi:hypothetical protein
MLTNKCHLFFYHYYPDYNHWLLQYIFGKELYLVIDELNMRRITILANTFKGKPIKYLKILNGGITGAMLNYLVINSERICMKNIIIT